MLKTITKFLIFIFFYCTTCFITNAKTIEPIIIDNSNINNIEPIYIYEDKSGLLNASEILKLDSFFISKEKSPNLGLSNSIFWIKFRVLNNTKFNDFILGCSNSIIDEFEIYQIDNNALSKKITLGDNQPFSERKYNHQFLMIDLNLESGTSKEYLLKVKSWEQTVIPLFIGSTQKVYESNTSHDMIFGLFFGIMFVLIFYNIFIFFTVRDSSYLYYIIYISFITLTQAALNGYSFKFIFPNSPHLSNISLIIFNSIAGLAAIKFIQTFLKTKHHLPRLNKGYYFIAVFYILGLITVLLNLKQVSYKLMDFGGFLISFFSLFIAIKMSLKGNQSAKFFLVAWSFFLVGVILFVLKNSGVLPANVFTNHTMTLGVTLEGILLSFALANKINIVQAEKEELILNQNIVLEQKVDERTNELNIALTNLKETQSQLVDAEKMSSLGQLTAGIAHEINNPINFVSSNIPPLRQDIEDLKSIILKYEEIDTPKNLNEKLKEIELLKEELDYEFLKEELNSIINGIEIGAKRTTEIVKGLRNFSRLDENDFLVADLNEGIKSTLAILKSETTDIDINIHLTPNCEIECYPGKLNQVFLNIINNAIHAVNKSNINKGLINISTEKTNGNVLIKITDNGIGITDDIKNKIFDPFFTTKKVGEGTGLGLSIVYRIIENHKGTIEVASEINKGTTFIIKLPTKQEKN